MMKVFSDAFKLLQEAVLSHYTAIETYPLFIKLGKAKTTQEENISTCDDIFAKYLTEVSKKTNAEYFKIVSKFMMLYRECLNKYGWLKLFENIAPQIETEEQKKQPSPDTSTSQPQITRQILLTVGQIDQMKDEYCVVNNGEFAPEVANEFVVLYLSEHNTGLQTNECINLVINMTEWLYSNGYTCTKVSTLKK